MNPVTEDSIVMADKQADTPAAETKKHFGWLKAIGGGMGGLLSGAIMMYASPLVDKFVKPTKPVANFEKVNEGTTVTFHNRTTGAGEGWWDFGDGSALEPYAPSQNTITHTYAHSGDYAVKLTVHNLYGDESDRTVSLHVDAAQAVLPPTIDAFEIKPVGGSYAPATFRIHTSVKNAQVFIWDVSDERPLEITSAALENQDRVITFDKPGGYEITMVAVNGTQHVEKTDIVQVEGCPKGMVTAIVTTTDQATHVENLASDFTFCESFPPWATEGTFHVDRQAPAKPGYEITDVRLVSTTGQAPRLQGKSEMAFDAPSACRGAKNLTLQLAADRRSVQLTGDLVKDDSLVKVNSPLPHLLVPVVIEQQKKTPVIRAAVPIAGALTAPGSAILSLPPVPADWIDTKRQVQLELRVCDKVVWHDSHLPKNAPVTLPSGRFLLTATPQGNQMRVDLTKATGAVTGN
jgi:PKD repeat protein